MFFSRIELYILTFLSFSAACSASANLLFSSSQATLSSGSRGRATTTSRGATTWTEKKERSNNLRAARKKGGSRKTCLMKDRGK